MSHHRAAEGPFWPAPVANAPLSAVLSVPGSKSVTARALLLAALADRPSLLEGALASRDTELMAEALRSFGATITAVDAGHSGEAHAGMLHIEPMPAPGHSAIADRVVHCGLAGTVMRFLPLIAALYPGATRFEGDLEALARPMAPLLDVARQLGAEVICHGEPGHLPFTVMGAPPQRNGHFSFPQVIEVDASSSSQFLSAALLAAPLVGLLDGQPHVIRPRGEVVSLPHVHMTAESLLARGIRVSSHPVSDAVAESLHGAATQNDGHCHDALQGDDAQRPSWTIEPGLPTGGRFSVEPDLSNAGVFLVAAMLTAGSVRIRHWPKHTTQAGDAWRSLLASLGAKVVRDHDDLVLTGPRDQSGRPSYPGFSWDLSAIGELTPTIAALALFASSPCELRGVAHIRGHETDRLAALAAEIRRLGGEVVEHDDGLTITPQARLLHPLRGADLESYADHRMATFGALVGLRVPGVRVAHIETTAKTFPGFAQMWQACVPTEMPMAPPSPSAARAESYAGDPVILPPSSSQEAQ